MWAAWRGNLNWQKWELMNRHRESIFFQYRQADKPYWYLNLESLTAPQPRIWIPLTSWGQCRDLHVGVPGCRPPNVISAHLCRLVTDSATTFLQSTFEGKTRWRRLIWRLKGGSSEAEEDWPFLRTWRSVLDALGGNVTAGGKSHCLQGLGRQRQALIWNSYECWEPTGIVARVHVCCAKGACSRRHYAHSSSVLSVPPWVIGIWGWNTASEEIALGTPPNNALAPDGVSYRLLHDARFEYWTQTNLTFLNGYQFIGHMVHFKMTLYNMS